MSTKHGLAEPKRTSSEAGINIGSMPEEEQSAIEGATITEKANIVGVAGADTSDWDAPALILSPSDKLIRKGNAGIRLGKDRNGSRVSGEGGAGSSRCAAIDIVAGNLGWLAKKRTKRGKPLYVDPDMRLDAARVYISQKSDVDGYFELARGNVGSTSISDLRSTVAVKADTVRIIARENIKLVTRTDEQNSQGGLTDNKYTRGYGIDLIACNDDSPGMLQPLVKGDNLVECLTAIVESIKVINNILNNFFDYDAEFKRAVQTHTHMSPFYGVDTAPDFKAVLQTGVKTAIASTLNVTVPAMLDMPLEFSDLKSTYLTNDGGIPGEKHILSRYNSTN
tara:strand:- start:801 stop:1811 length:1011 start_codon:yes stop_codon:yes gene_type:complete